VSARRGYPSDLTDAQWALVESLLPEPNTDGRREKHPRREIVNAILYVVRSGENCDDACSEAPIETRPRRSHVERAAPTSERRFGDKAPGPVAQRVSPPAEVAPSYSQLRRWAKAISACRCAGSLRQRPPRVRRRSRISSVRRVRLRVDSGMLAG
jgi:transposase